MLVLCGAVLCGTEWFFIYFSEYVSADELDLNGIRQEASCRVLYASQWTQPKAVAHSPPVLSSTCSRQMLPGTKFHLQAPVLERKQSTCKFCIDFSEHKYFPLGICCIPGYIAQVHPNSWNISFELHSSGPIPCGWSNLQTLMKLKNHIYQKISRNVSSWKLQVYLALNPIMIRFKTVHFSQRNLRTSPSFHLPQIK